MPYILSELGSPNMNFSWSLVFKYRYYRISLIRRHGYYLFCGMFGAAIIRGQHLFEGGVYFTQSLQMVQLLFEGGVYSKKYGIPRAHRAAKGGERACNFP